MFFIFKFFRLNIIDITISKLKMSAKKSKKITRLLIDNVQ